MLGFVPVVLLDVGDQKYRDPVLLPDSLQDQSMADSAPGDAAGGVGADADHPLPERGHVQPGAGLHHVRQPALPAHCGQQDSHQQMQRQGIPGAEGEKLISAELRAQIVVPGLLCSLQDLRSPPLLPLQSLGIRSLLLLSNLGLDRLHSLWIFVLNLPYEVIKRNQPMQ